MSKKIVDILKLEVTYYGITDDDTTLIELTIHNYRQNIKAEDEDKYSLASPFDKQTYLLDALLLSIYSRVYSNKAINKLSFFSPIDFLCSEDSFRQIQEFVENAGFEDSFKFIFRDEELLEDEEKVILYKLVGEEKLLKKGILNLHNTDAVDSFEENSFSVRAITFSTPTPEGEKYLEGFYRDKVSDREDERKVAIPYVDVY